MKATARRLMVSDVENLITVIEKNTRKQSCDNSRGVEIELWDDQVVVGTPIEVTDETIDFDTIYPIVINQRLSVYVRALVDNGKPFTTRTGRNEDTCTLKWTIRDSKDN